MLQSYNWVSQSDSGGVYWSESDTMADYYHHICSDERASAHCADRWDNLTVLKIIKLNIQ